MLVCKKRKKEKERTQKSMRSTRSQLRRGWIFGKKTNIPFLRNLPLALVTRFKGGQVVQPSFVFRWPPPPTSAWTSCQMKLAKTTISDNIRDYLIIFNMHQTVGMYFLVFLDNRDDIKWYDLQGPYYPIHSLLRRKCIEKLPYCFLHSPGRISCMHAKDVKPACQMHNCNLFQPAIQAQY